MTSPATRSVVVSLDVNVNAIAAVLVVSPELIVPDAIVMVGLVMSCVTKKLEEVVPETVAVAITVPSATPLMSAYVPVPSSSKRHVKAPVLASAVTESVTPP